MTDIVERLSLSSDPEKREAADEIERLRAALREILFEASTIQRAAEIARAALEGK
jgi:hypothetical protein